MAKKLILMRRLLAFVTVSALGYMTNSGYTFAEVKSEVDKACWPRTWQTDAVAVKLAECRRFADSLSEDDPLRIRAVDKQVTMLVSQGEFEEARALVNEFLKKHPDATDIRLRRIELIGGSSDASGTLDDLEYLHQHAANDPRFWAKYGNYQQMIGSVADALQSFSTGLSLDPKSLDLLQGRVYAYRSLGRSEEALADLNRMLDIDPQQWRAYLQRAELELSAGQPERTIADVQRSLAIGRSATDETGLLLAQAQIMLKKPKEALAALDAFLASVPVNVRPEERRFALTLRLGVLNGLGDKQGADEALTQLLQVTDQSQLLRLQVFLRNMGWRDVAITGQTDDATRAALGACIFLQACRSVLQNV